MTAARELCDEKEASGNLENPKDTTQNHDLARYLPTGRDIVPRLFLGREYSELVRHAARY